MPGIEQVGLKCRQREPVFTPLKAPLRRPPSIPERSSLRPLFIASLRRLLKAPFLVRVKPALPASFWVLRRTPLLAPILAAQQRPLLVLEQALLQPLHFAPHRASFRYPPDAGVVASLRRSRDHGPGDGRLTTRLALESA